MTNLSPLEQEHPATSLFPSFVGTYTEGDSEGIYKFLLHADGSISNIGLVAKTENPSWIVLSKDKSCLLAVNEIDTADGKGLIESYTVQEKGLTLSGRKSSGGAHPCFIAVNDDGLVVSANYTGANVSLYQLKEDHQLSDILALQQNSGSSVHERQQAAHTHSCWFEPGTNHILSLDLGADQVLFSQLDAKTQLFIPLPEDTLNLEPGSGPRHLCFHPNKKWIYIVNELNSTITVVHKSESGKYTLGDSFSTLPQAFSGNNTCSHIHITKDGAFVYAANRGYDSIAVFKTNFKDGSLSLIGQKSAGGKSPRSFNLSPDEKFLLIANLQSDNIVILKRNSSNGLLKYKSKFTLSSPACIAF